MSADVTSPEALRTQAEVHAARRQWPEAIAAYEALLARRPADADVLLQLSYTHSLAGHYRVAHGFALRAFGAIRGRAPDDVAIELLSRLRTFNEVPSMLAYIASLMPVSRMSIPMLLKCAAQLSYVNLPEQALELLDEAWRGDPNYPATLFARAQVLMYCGRFDEAREDVARGLRRAPEIAQGYWLGAALARQTRDANHVDGIRRQLARPGRKPAEVALLAFALHKELDDLGDHEEAWTALELACRAKRSTLDYQPQTSRALFNALQVMPELARGSRRQDVGNSLVPIFIVGMHRSGTTLLEQLLDGSQEVRGFGELYDFTSAMRWATDHHCHGVIDTGIVSRALIADISDAGRRYIEGVRWRLSGERFFTDKLPSNFLNLGFIATALPQAKILHMVRDPMETCFSNLRELFSEANPYSYVQEELAMFHNGYRALMRHWHWRYPGRILDVDYARLTREPEAVMREVCAHCGVAFKPDMLDVEARKRSVVTASAVQVRRGIAAREQPKWAPYERHLQPLIRALET